jgi:TonB family protein
MFGAQLETEKTVAHAGDSSKWMLIAAAVAVLAIICAGGYYFLNQHAAARAAQVTPAASPEAAVSAAPPANVSPVPPSPVPVNTAKNLQPRSAVTAPAPAASTAPREGIANGVKQPQPSPASTQEPVAAPVAEQHRSANNGNMPNLFGSLNAHPVATRAAAHEEEAPAVPGVTSSGAEGLAAITPPPSALPAPPASTTKPARLISSVPAVYPEFARQRGIGGTVVIQATIEANGAVGATKVLSGPQSLRESAVHALRQWKYEPGRVDGQPAPTEVTVTLHFNNQ